MLLLVLLIGSHGMAIAVTSKSGSMPLYLVENSHRQTILVPIKLPISKLAVHEKTAHLPLAHKIERLSLMPVAENCIFDLVIDHTSDDHPWFQESNSSKTNPKRDWYFWRPPQYKNGTRYPPNNWAGYNGESAWTYDEHTGEYYLGIFSPVQIDLNWENADVRNAIYQDALRFWLDAGIDGFRIDVVSYYSKTPELPNFPADDDGFYPGIQFYVNGPHEHQYLQEMNRKVLSQYETLTVGEYANSTTNMTIMQDYVGAHRRELNTIFYFNMVAVFRNGYEPLAFNLSAWRETIAFNDAIGDPATGDGWNTVFLENHDLPRSVSSFGDETAEYRAQSAKLLSMFISTMSGTLFLYQGQELV
ncbi:hypothetical protein PRZ48_005438 [Zasmidium cellare]|uniref:Glycosyl hydrolase family 13 catalytic domain-containing protein n=1 Tax=Zasmidium cellare TaxID=395010 RepID=A0ABR0ESM0_ZASCE|nr:hypothetical protein PRZ48_005438 [Zasmidium cellare]